MKIKKIFLQTHKLKELQEFYGRLMGLPLQESNGDGFAVMAGQTALHFQKTTSSEPYYHFAFNIPENQLQEARIWLKDRVQLISYEGNEIIDFPNWDAHSLYFYDPAGNIVELIARHQLSTAASTVFGPHSFLSISEIGLPNDNPHEIAERLHKEIGLDYFRDSKTDNFNALGDDEGLLLIVSQKRHWFPTEVNSRMFPVRVEIEDSKNLSLSPLPYEIIGLGN